MDVEHISALEFLDAEKRATRNAADKPQFNQLLAELEKLPKAQQRLAFEFLAMAWRSLKLTADPGGLIAWAAFYGKSIEAQRLSVYIFWLERIIIRSFEILGQLEVPAHGIGPFSLGLKTGLGALRRMDPNRFQAVVHNLSCACGDGERDPRWKVLIRILKRPAN